MKKNTELERKERSLFPHQERALEYCRSTKHPALFMEMRLGKTKVMIEWLRRATGKILVVAPLSVVRSWDEELQMEGESRPVLLLGASGEKLASFSAGLEAGAKWFLVNFEGITRCQQLVSNYRWDAIIVDESTRLKNPKAQVTKTLIQYRANADRRAILSGNPAPEGPLDYCEQFRFLHGSFLGIDSYWKFRNVAFFPVGRGFEWLIKKPFKEKIKYFIQKFTFTCKRADVGLANQKFYEKRMVQMEPEQKKLMKKLESDFVLELPSGEEKQTIWVPVKLAWMARLAGGYVDGKKWFEGKFEELRSLLLGELKEEQVVVWFRFNSEIHHALKSYGSLGKDFAFIDGTVAEDDRAVVRKNFMEKRIRVLFLQSKVGMFGLDLSCASTAIYFSNNYSSEIRTQSEDRIEHPLKKEPLLIIDLVTEGSLDEDAVKALRRKKKESDSYLIREIANSIKERNRAKIDHSN